MSNNRQSRQEVLDGERAVNERYLHEMEAWLRKTKKAELPLVISQNSVWANDVPKAAPGNAVVGPVVGRVALRTHDPILGNDFYIGTWWREWDGVAVVSWAAPVAKLFFNKPSPGPAGDIDPSEVGARRSFRNKHQDLVDYEDDLVAGTKIDEVFVAQEATLVVPAAPRIDRPARPAVAESPPAPLEEPVRFPIEPETGEVINLREIEEIEAMRAGRLVLDAISKPRTTELRGVLSTLQPAQYRLVTWPHDEPLVVQGQPGSGKTIVATHRAGYLTHRDRAGDRLERVAVIGPSEQWKQHITASIADVGGQGVNVFSLPDLMQELSFGLNHELHFEGENYLDTDWELGRLADRAAKKLRSKFVEGGKAPQLARLIVDQLVKPTPLHNDLVSDPELSSWLLRAKSFDNARQKPKYLPFLAAVGLAVNKPTRAQRFQHLIVDEAQDVRPLEWRILSELLVDGGGWSLFGDIYQRRSDSSVMSWTNLEEYLEFPIEEQVISTGFRSTNQILKFASRLLPSGERNITGLRSGPAVGVTRTSVKSLIGIAVENAVELLDAYPHGTVGVIAMEDEVQGVISDLMASGWRKTLERSVLGRDGRKIGVYRPVQARGLEFDGVVVVEPDAFPENVGRKGRLYTSLTRANQELRIAHSKGMPKELK